MQEKRGFRLAQLTVGASNDLQMERNLTGGLPVLYQGHSANPGPFQELFLPLTKQGLRGVTGAARVSDRETDNGGKGPDASFKKHAEEMQMMTWQNATRKQMTWQRQRITGRHLAHRIRGVTTLLH